MSMLEGAIFISSLNGKLYRLKTIRNGMAILRGEDGTSEVLTEKNNLDLFYLRVGG